MNIINKIKLLFRTKSEIEDIIKEGNKMENNKPGWKKTEFWVSVLTVHLPTLYSAIQGFIPPEKAAYIHIAAVAAFAIFNTVHKAIESWKSVKANQATVTTTAPVTTVTTPS